MTPSDRRWPTEPPTRRRRSTHRFRGAAPTCYARPDESVGQLPRLPASLGIATARRLGVPGIAAIVATAIAGIAVPAIAGVVPPVSAAVAAAALTAMASAAAVPATTDAATVTATTPMAAPRLAMARAPSLTCAVAGSSRLARAMPRPSGLPTPGVTTSGLAVGPRPHAPARVRVETPAGGQSNSRAEKTVAQRCDEPIQLRHAQPLLCPETGCPSPFISSRLSQTAEGSDGDDLVQTQLLVRGARFHLRHGLCEKNSCYSKPMRRGMHDHM